MKATIITAAALGVLATADARAQCSYGSDGFLFVSATCTSGDHGACAQLGHEQALFVSNVFYDNGSNGTYPAGEFFSELEYQHGVRNSNTLVSNCEIDDRAAERRRREIISRYRNMGYAILAVRVGDT